MDVQLKEKDSKTILPMVPILYQTHDQNTSNFYKDIISIVFRPVYYTAICKYAPNPVKIPF